jgi:hypothetical protein
MSIGGNTHPYAKVNSSRDWCIRCVSNVGWGDFYELESIIIMLVLGI